MQYEMTEEQKLFQSTIEKLLERSLPFEKRFKRVEEQDSFDDNLWKILSEAGMVTLHLCENHGGIDASTRDLQCLMEVIGKYLVLEPYSAYLIGGSILHNHGNKTQKEILKQASTGKVRICSAIDPNQQNSLIAKKHNDHWHLSGQLNHVEGAKHASHIIFQALDEKSKKPMTFIVEKSSLNMKMTFRNVDDSTSSHIIFNDQKIYKENQLSLNKDLFKTIMPLLYALQSAEALGAARAMNEKTRDYLKQRVQFKRPLSSFQVLKHRMVETFLLEEQIASMSYTLGLGLDAEVADQKNHQHDLEKLALQTKMVMCTMGKKIAEECVQLHGGMGVSHELDIAHYMRKITTLRIKYGDQTTALADLMSEK